MSDGWCPEIDGSYMSEAAAIHEDNNDRFKFMWDKEHELIVKLKEEIQELHDIIQIFIDPEAGEIDRKLAIKDARNILYKGDV